RIRGIEIDHLHVELDLLPFLRKELSIKTLFAEGVRVDRVTNEQKGSAKGLPFAITIHSFQIKDFKWPSLPPFNMEGEFQIKKNGRGSLAIDVTGPLEATLSVQG